MSAVAFEAAWMPYSVVDYERAVLPTVGWIAQRTGRPKVLALHELRAAQFTPTLHRYSTVATVVTPRTRERWSSGNDVLAYVPDWKLLELASWRAGGGRLAVVEESDVVLRDWAQAVSALNLGTGVPTSDPATDEVREAVDRIHFYGNNGWSKHYAMARTMTQSRLRDLADSGWTDGHRIIGGVFALGKSAELLKDLQGLVEAAFGPLKREHDIGSRYINADDSPRCAVDGFAMVDLGRNGWDCRSCGHWEPREVA